MTQTIVSEGSIIRVLRENQILSAFSDEDLAELAVASTFHKCDRGETIWIKGDQVPFFGCIASGFVKLVKPSANGNEMMMEIMGPRQTFGLLGCITGSGCPLMAVGLTETSYVKIPKSIFLSLYGDSHASKDTLVRLTASRIHQKLDFMAKLSSGRVDERIAAIILTLADSYGRKSPLGTKLSVPLTRQALGELSGTTTESAIRVISKWTQEGILETEKHHITILDRTQLEAKLSSIFI